MDERRVFRGKATVGVRGKGDSCLDWEGQRWAWSEEHAFEVFLGERGQQHLMIDWGRSGFHVSV